MPVLGPEPHAPPRSLQQGSLSPFSRHVLWRHGHACSCRQGMGAVLADHKNLPNQSDIWRRQGKGCKAGESNDFCTLDKNIKVIILSYTPQNSLPKLFLSHMLWIVSLIPLLGMGRQMWPSYWPVCLRFFRTLTSKTLRHSYASDRQEVHEHAKLAGPPCQRKLRNDTDQTQLDFTIMCVKRLSIYFYSIGSTGNLLN